MRYTLSPASLAGVVVSDSSALRPSRLRAVCHLQRRLPKGSLPGGCEIRLFAAIVGSIHSPQFTHRMACMAVRSVISSICESVNPGTKKPWHLAQVVRSIVLCPEALKRFFMMAASPFLKPRRGERRLEIRGRTTGRRRRCGQDRPNAIHTSSDRHAPQSIAPVRLAVEWHRTSARIHRKT